MRRIIFSVLMLTLVFVYSISFSSCGMLQEHLDIYESMDHIANKLGNTQITSKNRLVGERLLAEDGYTGIYTADCHEENGREVIFGGASVKERQIHVYGKIKSDTGKITLKVRENAEVFTIEPETDGTFDTYLDFSTGGNYIMADYDDFSGAISLAAEYTENTDHEKLSGTIQQNGQGGQICQTECGK